MYSVNHCNLPRFTSSDDTAVGSQPTSIVEESYNENKRSLRLWRRTLNRLSSTRTPPVAATVAADVTGYFIPHSVPLSFRSIYYLFLVLATDHCLYCSVCLLDVHCCVSRQMATLDGRPEAAAVAGAALQRTDLTRPTSTQRNVRLQYTAHSTFPSL